ncbi:unnamed protein product [Urochloa humidicola]
MFFLEPDLDETATGMGLNMSNVKILCVQLRRCRDDGSSKTVEACVSSARDHHWLQLGTMAIGNTIPGRAPFCFVGRVGGSICWSNTIRNNVALLHLNESTGEFSCFTLPASVNTGQLCYDRWSLRLLRIAGDDLEVLCHDRSSGVCVVERRVCLSAFSQCRRWYFSDDMSDEAAAPGRILLCDRQDVEYYVLIFSVHRQNIELQRARKLSRHSDGRRAFPYELPWTISACL